MLYAHSNLLLAFPASSDWSLSSEPSEADWFAHTEVERKKAAQEKRLAALNELDEYGLEPAVQVIRGTCLFINRSAYDRIKYSVESVIMPSLATKMYGRWAIISGLVTPISHGIGAYLLSNLMYASPEIALIAGLVRFAWVLISDLYSGKSFAEAFKNASKEAIKTAIKFFIVYTVWTLAIAAGTTLGILSGGMLPLGILLVAGLTCLGFAFATFIVDKLPGILAEPKKSWETFKDKLANLSEKISELKACILPGLFEGASWTLMDSSVVNISGHILGFAGRVLDLLGISLAVAGAFFVGAVIHASISRYYAIHKKPKKILDPMKQEKIQLEITNFGKKAPTSVRELSYILDKPDPRLNATVIHYMQAKVLIKVTKRLLDPNTLRPDYTELFTENEKLWIKGPSSGALASASCCTLFSRADFKPRQELKIVEKVIANLGDKTKSKQAREKIQKIQDKARKRKAQSRDVLEKEFGLRLFSLPKKSHQPQDSGNRDSSEITFEVGF